MMKSNSIHHRENHVVSFYEKMRRTNWIKGEASILDNFIALRLANTLITQIRRKNLIDNNALNSLQQRLVQRNVKHLETEMIDRTCSGATCGIIKLIMLS